MKEKQTAGRRQLEEFAPEFARYNDDILFGEVWAKEDHLTDKTRSIITIVYPFSRLASHSANRWYPYETPWRY